MCDHNRKPADLPCLLQLGSIASGYDLLSRLFGGSQNANPNGDPLNFLSRLFGGSPGT